LDQHTSFPGQSVKKIGKLNPPPQKNDHFLLFCNEIELKTEIEEETNKKGKKK